MEHELGRDSDGADVVYSDVGELFLIGGNIVGPHWVGILDEDDDIEWRTADIREWVKANFGPSRPWSPTRAEAQAWFFIPSYLDRMAPPSWRWAQRDFAACDVLYTTPDVLDGDIENKVELMRANSDIYEFIGEPRFYTGWNYLLDHRPGFYREGEPYIPSYWPDAVRSPLAWANRLRQDSEAFCAVVERAQAIALRGDLTLDEHALKNPNAWMYDVYSDYPIDTVRRTALNEAWAFAVTRRDPSAVGRQVRNVLLGRDV